jgi:hypothetical protein
MQPIDLSSIAKLFLVSCLCLAFLSCQKDEAPDIGILRNDTLVPDPYAAEKAKQWKYSQTGSNRASFLVNGVCKNISGVRQGIMTNFGIAIDRMSFVKDVDNIPFWLTLTCDTSNGHNLNRVIRIVKDGFYTGRDSACFVPIRSGFKDANGNIAGLKEDVFPTLVINRTSGMNTSDGFGHGWLKIKTYLNSSYGNNKIVTAGEFELHFGYQGDSIHITNGWFDVNSHL